MQTWIAGNAPLFLLNNSEYWSYNWGRSSEEHLFSTSWKAVSVGKISHVLISVFHFHILCCFSRWVFGVEKDTNPHMTPPKASGLLFLCARLFPCIKRVLSLRKFLGWVFISYVFLKYNQYNRTITWSREKADNAALSFGCNACEVHDKRIAW